MFAILLGAASALAQPPGLTPPVRPAPAPPPPPRRVPPPPPALTPVDPATVPAACHDLALRAGSTNFQLAEASRVSLALCLAQDDTAQVAVCDCDQSVHDLDDAASPAFAILDELATLGEPVWQVAALHAEGELLGQLAQKVLQAVPPAPAGASEDEQNLHDVRAQLVQPLVEPWLERARDRFAQVARLAQQHPELAKNPTAATAIRDSRQRRATAAANR
ncbi:MAG: hypothetical protein ACM31C_07320, partial [Acidobacteriota bacterium]